MSDEYFDEEEFSSKFDGHTFNRIVGLMKPHWKWVLGFTISIFFVSALDSLFTYLSKIIIDDGIVAKDVDKLVNTLILYGTLMVVQAILIFCFIYLVGVLGERIRYDLRKSMFNHLQRLSLSYYSKTPVGWIMSRITSDSDRVADLLTWGLLDSTWGLVNIITSMVFMFIINWRLALIILFILPFMIVIAVEFRKRILVQFRISRKMNSKITGAFNETIMGVRVIKALGREQQNNREFKGLTGDMYQSSYRAAVLSALFLPSIQIVSALTLGAVVWYSGTQVNAGSITIGGIQAFISYITFMMWPIQDLARVFAELQHAIASAERIFSLIDAQPDIVDQPGAIDPGTISGDIEFKNIAFAYDSDKAVLTDFSLFVRRGENIALVGPTGGGKSTIVNLLCRFYQPNQGQILIGGKDYTHLSMAAIQSRLGVVLQTPHLFSGTIRENLSYGRLNATDAEIIEAAKIAGADAFISSLENGYDTQVGEGGNLLSTGQKQLISLARAILAKPEIFIMDEATSSVDTVTESLIQQGMDELMKKCTSFIIAHRLSTIKRCDRIVVIEDGHISEMGTHHELLQQRGKYYQLYTRQFRQQRQEVLDPFQVTDTQSEKP
ncbi:MAG: ABC transporter ATP-binding protein [Anaerolineae bacterium]|nr:ABC transporter ATP-binding protein [Anaerolineae bacterium]